MPLLKPGKIPNELLRELLAQLPQADTSILLPPAIGLDAGAIKLQRNNIIAVTTDPITFATHDLGHYSVSVNMNDLACLGCEPRWYSNTLLLPLGSTVESLQAIWKNLIDALNAYHILVIGGHTEVTAAVNHPILVGQMLGEPIAGQSLLSTKNIKPGDQLLLAQAVAVEGTALLAHEHATALTPYFSKQEITAMQNLLHAPGICIWPMVKQLLPDNQIIAMHDPTEGGVATAIHEMADAANCGIVIDAQSLAILPATQRLCELLHINPLGLLASGSLLIACPAAHVDAVLANGDGSLQRIGEFTANKEQRVLKSAQTTQALPRFSQDEIIIAGQNVS